MVDAMPDEARAAIGTVGPTPPMVGRTAERVLLSEQLSAMEFGRGNVVIIGGEAGIGKTTIARDLAAHARARGYHAFVGHSYDLMAAPPYGLWLDLAEGYRRITNSPELPPLPDMLANRSPERITSQATLFSEITTFLQSIAEVRPTIVVLEDVHWADPASLELLRHISSRVSHLPLLLVVTYRVDELTRQNPFYRQLPALVRESEGLRLNLNRLGTQDLGALVTLHYTLSFEDRVRLVSYLEDHAEGNPFFTMELLRALEEQDDGGLVRNRDTWMLTELDRILVPPLVRQVIDTRVAQLGETTRLPLTTAAVIGHEIPIDLLASVTGLPEADLYAAIDKAIEWHVLTATPDGSGIQFVHALTREALYETIPPHRRAVLHRAVAEALEARSTTDADSIAYHYQHAKDPRAPDWLIRAGERAQRAYAWLTARDRFAAAAALLEKVPGEEGARARLLYRCGRLQRYSHTEEGIENLRSAAQLAQLAGDKVLAADAIYSRGLLQCFADQWQSGVADMVGGVEILEALPPEEARISWAAGNWMADALPVIDLATSTDVDSASDQLASVGVSHRRGSLPWFLAAVGRFEEAQSMAAAYRGHITDLGIGPLIFTNLGHMEFGLATTHASLGRPDEAMHAFAAAHEMYLRVDHHACIAFLYLAELMDVVIPYQTTNTAKRQHLADAAQRSLEKASGAFAGGTSERLAQLTVMYLDGHWSEVRSIVKESATPDTYNLRRQITHALAPIAWHQGRHLEAWGHVLSILPDGPQSRPGTAVFLDALMLQRLAANLAIDDGEFALARAWLEANDRWLAWNGSVIGRAENALAWSKWRWRGGAVDDAWMRATQAIEEAQEPHQPLVLIEAHRLKGELALHRGDIAEAQGELSTSLELATACAVPFQRALTLIELAHAGATSGEEGAIDLALGAMAICEPLQAQPALNQIDELLITIRSKHVDTGPPAGLTMRELEVLRLVAQGLTDAEAGDRLSISSRTVSQHLRSVYGKLEVRSRTEATRFAIERGVV